MKLSQVNGGPSAYGFGAAIYGWFLEQLMSTDGQLYCDPGNGRSGARVTSVDMDSPEIVSTLAWWHGMVADGLAVNTGRQTKAAQNAFEAQQTAITLESTGTLKAFSAAAAGHFELGAAPFPTVSGPLVERRRPVHRRRQSVDLRVGTFRGREGGLLGVREVSGLAGVAGLLAHQHRLFPGQQRRPGAAGGEAVPEAEPAVRGGGPLAGQHQAGPDHHRLSWRARCRRSARPARTDWRRR